MAADLFESYAVMLVAALILGKVAFGSEGLVFPLIVPMIGVITAMFGIFLVAPRQNDRSGMTAINRGFFASAVISLVLVDHRGLRLPAVQVQRSSWASPTQRSCTTAATRGCWPSAPSSSAWSWPAPSSC